MAGPPSGLKRSWRRLREGERAITMDDPHPASQFLGCDYHVTEELGADGKPVTVLRQDT